VSSRFENAFTDFLLMLAVVFTTSCAGSHTNQTANQATLVSIAVTPKGDSIAAGRTLQFTAVGTSSNGSKSNITNSVSWISTDTSAVTITPSGLANGVTAGQSTSILATQDHVVGSTSLNVTLPISISISPKRAGLALTQTLSITAITNDDAGVMWTATGGGFSSIVSESGVDVTYTAPISAGLYAITATSVTDPTESFSIPVYVTDLSGVYTYHNDLARDGTNAQEYALTTSNVNTSTFGKLFSCVVDGAIYAQPLWVANLAINGARHNVVFVATQHDSLFAFDADAGPCVQLWQVSLIDTDHGASPGEMTVPSGTSGNLVGKGNGDIAPEVGVTGTPVIDASTNTLYVVSKSMNAGATAFFQRLHAIDITTGNEKFGGPAHIDSSITFPGSGDGGSTVGFNPLQENQRAGLALANDLVYVAWASHEDNPPYYGWVVGFDPFTLAVTSVLNVSPNVQYGGIWMSGGAPALDANDNLYVLTGNATFDATNATTPNDDYGDSFLQLTPTLTVSTYFTPSDQATDNTADHDFGAGGATVVQSLTWGTLRNLIVGGGKDGNLFLLSGDGLGGLGDSNSRQNFNIGHRIFATGAFWNNTYYIAGADGPLALYDFNSSTYIFDTSIASQSSTTYGFPGASPSISSMGSNNGIVWALDNSNFCTVRAPSCGPAILHAYDATTLSSDLWNSSMVPGDAAGNAVKFTVPTIANGKVYIGTRGNNTGGVYGSTSVSGELDVYGLKPN